MGENQTRKHIVDETLQLPKAAEMQKDLDALLENEAEVVLVMLDLDKFLFVNQNYGYDTGDQVLIAAARHIQSMLPKEAKLYRYGGDQFAALFSGGEEKESIFLLMERIRKTYNVNLPDGELQTITIGIAAYPDDAGTAGELIRKSEGAMFRGKLNGNNRVCLAREEKMQTKTTHYTIEQLKRLSRIAQREGIGEAVLLREALDALLKKYDG